MTDKTIKERKARLLERDKVRGVVSVRVRVPEAFRPELLAICEAARKAGKV